MVSLHHRKIGRTQGQLWEICFSKCERYEGKFVSELGSFCLWWLETCLQHQARAAVCTARWLYCRSPGTSVAGSVSVEMGKMNAPGKRSGLPRECSCPEASPSRNKLPFHGITPIQRCQRGVGEEALSQLSCLSPLREAAALYRWREEGVILTFNEIPWNEAFS